MGQCTKFRYLSHRRAAKAQASLHIHSLHKVWMQMQSQTKIEISLDTSAWPFFIKPAPLSIWMEFSIRIERSKTHFSTYTARIIIGLVQENLTLLHSNNKGADQPAHLRSLISHFVICSLESVLAKLATCKVSVMQLVSVVHKSCSPIKLDGIFHWIRIV